ncbi:sensor domain-containing diguanylate cyclase [Angustibacter luteus]|uniref:Sensor domain-containing diguanylate cyclase n=1 Tax=Angustibacter luteus TaxID=658456 RepID=A0ABW1JC94_9ACTN
MKSVRSRLAVVLGVVLLIPALAALLAIGVLAPRQVNQAAGLSMTQAASSVGAALQARCLAMGEAARVLALQARTQKLQIAARNAISRQSDGFSMFVKDGKVVASAGTTPDMPVSELLTSSCSKASAIGVQPLVPTGLPVVSEVVQAVDAKDNELGTAIVGQVYDQQRLNALAAVLGLPSETDLALACPQGRGVSTQTGALGAKLRMAAASSPGVRDIEDRKVAISTKAQGQYCGVAAAIAAPGLALTQGWLALALVLALVIGMLLVVRLAASLTRPVLALTEAAERVARGDLSTRLPAAGQDELGRLSGAFNHMTDELELKLTELERSRNLLRENVARLGDTLERTHDLEGLLGTVLSAAASATESQRATAWLVEGGSVVARASVPAGAPRAVVRRLPLGGDLAGEVAVDGMPRRLGHGHEDSTTVLGGPALAAPLRRGHHTVGVIVVEREPSRPAYDTDAEAMLVSLAGPAGIAVDNVLLHREAQRLSVTDPLTGAGNLRHMTTTLAREVERASRFERPLSVLLLDLDHFKNVNDTYGHTVGDAVLRELARRLASVVREVDTVARYGGEEFVVVTPETDTEGAEHLAERICEAVREEPFIVGEDSVDVTVSVGISSLPMHGSASGDLVRAADDGLYAAKRAGRNQWQVAATSHVPPQGLAAGEEPVLDR